MTFSDIFKSSFIEKITSFSALDACIAMVLAFAIGLFIFFVYKQHNTNGLHEIIYKNIQCCTISC